MKLVNVRFAIVASTLTLAACGQGSKNKNSNSGDAAPEGMVEIPVSVEESSFSLANGTATATKISVKCDTYTAEFNFLPGRPQTIKAPRGAQGCEALLTELTVDGISFVGEKNEESGTYSWINQAGVTVRTIEIDNSESFDVPGDGTAGSVSFSFKMVKGVDSTSTPLVIQQGNVASNVTGNLAPAFESIALADGILVEKQEGETGQHAQFSVLLNCSTAIETGTETPLPEYKCKGDKFSEMKYQVFAGSSIPAAGIGSGTWKSLTPASVVNKTAKISAVKTPMAWNFSAGANNQMIFVIRNQVKVGTETVANEQVDVLEYSYTYFMLDSATEAAAN